MSQTPQSKILSIDEQIKQLQEKKKKEITKLERSVGKKFLDTFDQHNNHVDDIFKLIEKLKETHTSEIDD